MTRGSRLFGLAGLRRLAWLPAAALLTTWTAAPASAVLDHRITFPYEFTAWDCGYPIEISGSQTEVVTYRAGRGSDILFTFNYAWHETWTGPDGRTAGASGNGVFKQVKATLVEGTTYRVVAQNSGVPFTVYDGSGRVLLRDRGTYQFTFQVDINNWDATWTFLGDRVSGPHPSFYTDACKSVAPSMGSGSEQYLTPRPMGSTGFPLNYYEYLPPSYSATGDASPVIVFFNGYGESGDGTPNSVDLLLNAGLPRFINVGAWPVDRPFVVLAMQHVDTGFDFSSCDGVPWGGSCNMFVQDARDNAPPAFCTTPDEVHDFISFVVSHYNVDPHRVYATGLSCGAFGTWEYLAEYGHSQIAAAVPIAGEGRPAWGNAGCALADVPIWAFHGALDDVVDPNGSVVTMGNVQGCAAATADSAKLTVYPDRDHNSWDPAYDGQYGDDIYSWMLTHTNP